MTDGKRITIVTGAAGALGSAVIERLTHDGHYVVAVARSNSHARNDAQVLWAAFDVLARDAWTETLQRVEREVGPITGAVLAAGGWKGGSLQSPDGDSVWHAMIDSNLETARVSMQALLPSMVSARHGSIVLIGSRAVERPWESAGAAAYAAAKSATIALMRAVSADVLASGVRLNAVLPSTLDTEANRRAMPKADRSQWVDSSSLAGVIAFLLSEDARDVSGAAIPVYGRA